MYDSSGKGNYKYMSIGQKVTGVGDRCGKGDQKYISLGQEVTVMCDSSEQDNQRYMSVGQKVTWVFDSTGKVDQKYLSMAPLIDIQIQVHVIYVNTSAPGGVNANCGTIQHTEIGFYIINTFFIRSLKQYLCSEKYNFI